MLTNFVFCLRRDCKSLVGIKNAETLYIQTPEGILEIPVEDAELLSQRLLQALKEVKKWRRKAD